MLVPGSNLLNMALRVINPQGISLQRHTGRAKNGVGVFVDSYAAAVPVQGSVQPLDAKAYQMLGLDLAKKYVTVFTSTKVQTVERDKAGDLMTYDGLLYKAESNQDWTGQDGWGAYLFVKVDRP